MKKLTIETALTATGFMKSAVQAAVPENRTADLHGQCTGKSGKCFQFKYSRVVQRNPETLFSLTLQV
jgi:hypothetical protein